MPPRGPAEPPPPAEPRIRMPPPARHTRAIAQAEAAGITGIRDALTANA